jgi:hypothetical protein
MNAGVLPVTVYLERGLPEGHGKENEDCQSHCKPAPESRADPRKIFGALVLPHSRSHSLVFPGVGKPAIMEALWSDWHEILDESAPLQSLQESTIHKHQSTIKSSDSPHRPFRLSSTEIASAVLQPCHSGFAGFPQPLQAASAFRAHSTTDLPATAPSATAKTMISNHLRIQPEILRKIFKKPLSQNRGNRVLEDDDPPLPAFSPWLPPLAAGRADGVPPQSPVAALYKRHAPHPSHCPLAWHLLRNPYQVSPLL